MIIMGIDYGDARVGIAVSDRTELIATAVCTINVKGMRDAAEKTAAKAAELGAGKLVLGLPRNMDGSEGARAEKTRAFAEMLAPLCGLETGFCDERLSTVEAYTFMNIAEYNGKKRRRVVDALSAQIILQTALDSARAAKAKGE
ncbi:MAG: Holliday junction resolvase RuvX [Clostridia bacterium]|nr:Holliday junction resolvase RuvX [Clostridia bacterium]